MTVLEFGHQARSRTWRGISHLAAMAPGALVALAMALACRALAPWLHAPAPLLAILAGLASAQLLAAPRWKAGLTLCAKPGLKIGVALLGAQVTLADIGALGVGVGLGAGAVVLTTLAAGTGLGLALGLPMVEAVIAAASVAICGASAALAAAAVLPETPDKTRTTLAVVCGVNILSTAAMLIYPLIAHAVGLKAQGAGVFFGLSIHDVAQVAGAGAAVSPAATASAAVTKLTRVLCLAPVAVAIGALARWRMGGQFDGGKAPPLAPGFVIGFAALVIARNLGLLPGPIASLLTQASSLLLLAGVAAIGALLSPKEILKVKPQLVLVLVGATVVAAVIGLGAALWMQG